MPGVERDAEEAAKSIIKRLSEGIRIDQNTHIGINFGGGRPINVNVIHDIGRVRISIGGGGGGSKGWFAGASCTIKLN